ncbi:MAG: DNA replication and repair protein RecF [Candidatus Marinimicrobia bacterium]|nr:DNA replication and repair protein RecF [Candidatus Neomarinimicrobiota bacterium]
MLKSLQLQNFRSYQKEAFKFFQGTNLVVGSNTSGKTNLLEAIYLLATGKSFRAQTEQEMISYERELARVKAVIEGEEDLEELEIILTPGQIQNQRTLKKQYLLNGVRKRQIDFLGHLNSVFFGPEDLEIVIGSPSIRRDYLDAVLEQVDRDYRRASLSYQKSLRQRNKLLEQIRDKGRAKSSLFLWNKLILENGEVMSQKRGELIDFINQQPDYFGDLVIDYQKNLLSPLRLEQYQAKEIGAGMTLIGPHRDDFTLNLVNGGEERNLHLFGSRGEQRTAVFSLKLAELEFVATKTGQRPILLLDDIFSELDHERRQHLVTVIPKQQTILTTTDIHLVEPDYRKKVKMIKLK